jgi:beta-galactosidase
VDGKTVDVNKVVTGFRKTAFKGGAGTGGVYLNDKFVYLKGYAQRSSNEWAGLGGGYPDWMHDFTAQMLRDSHGNYMRWMHIAPQRVDADSFDRFGIIQICPGGDKERDAVGRQWEQRLEVMRDTMIYFRNSPSILFWEAGNTVVTVEHMQQMVALRKQWDPDGGRVIGARGNDNVAANTATTPIAEFYGIMIGQDPRTDSSPAPPTCSADTVPSAATARRSLKPRTFEMKARAASGTIFRRRISVSRRDPTTPGNTPPRASPWPRSNAIRAYWDNRISNPDPAHSKWSGYASIYFSDSDADGRQDSSEVCRVSGKVDAVRLPKEIYFAHRVMQNEQPDIHILGHWSYPTSPAKKTVKTIYVIANTQSVELFVNGKSHGVNSQPANGYAFAFPDVEFAPGV